MLFKTTIIGFVVFTLIAFNSSVKSSYVKSIAVIAETKDQISVISKKGAEHRVSFWKEARKEKDGFIGFVDQNNEKHKRFLKALDEKKIKYELKSTDELFAKIKKQISRKPSVRGMAYDYNKKFYRFDEIHSELDRIAADHSNKGLKAKVVTIGQTFEKKPIKGIQISKEGDNRGIVVIECGAHAREWSAVSSCMWIINQLLNRQNDPKVTSFEFIIIPVFNVDGYAFTWTDNVPIFPGDLNRLWRKSRQVVKNGPSGSAATDETYEKFEYCTGTDLNRNFETSSWCTHLTGLNFQRHQCGKDISCGAHPFSAPETAALRDFLTPIKDQIVIYLAVHSFAAMWLYSLGFKNESLPETPEWDDISKAAVDAIKAVNGVQYKYGNGMKIMYASEGESPDWAYEKLKVKYPFTIEVSPPAKKPHEFPEPGQIGQWLDYQDDSFMLTEDKIEPTAKELWAGIEAAIIKISLLNYPDFKNEGAQEKGTDTKPSDTKGTDNKSTDMLPSIITLIGLFFGVSVLLNFR